MKQDELTNMLAGVIRGILDGEISASRANAICNVTGEIVKIARLKHQLSSDIIDSVAIPTSDSPSLLAHSLEDTKDTFSEAIYKLLCSKGPMKLKDLGESLDCKWEYIEMIARDDERFYISGNEVFLSAA